MIRAVEEDRCDAVIGLTGELLYEEWEVKDNFFAEVTFGVISEW